MLLFRALGLFSVLQPQFVDMALTPVLNFVLQSDGAIKSHSVPFAAKFQRTVMSFASWLDFLLRSCVCWAIAGDLNKGTETQMNNDGCRS